MDYVASALAGLFQVLAQDKGRLWPSDIKSVEQAIQVLQGLRTAKERSRYG